MANQVYLNYILKNEFEDQINSHLDLMRFATRDDSLVEEPGMTVKVRVYSATDGVEKLAQGQGNTKSVETAYSDKDYTVLTAQGRFEYFDEEVKKDPLAIMKGNEHLAEDMFNSINSDVYAEFLKATRTHTAASPDFAAFVRAAAMFKSERIRNERLFALVHPTDMAEARIALENSIKYADDFARDGYAELVAGIELHEKADAEEGTIVIATKKAVTVFNKTGTEVEIITQGNRSADDANRRKNTVFIRKYYIAALTDDTRAVKLTLGG